MTSIRQGLAMLPLAVCLLLPASVRAVLPRDAAVERLAPDRIALVWTPTAAAPENFRVRLDTSPTGAGQARPEQVASRQGRIELAHEPGQRP